MDEVGLGMLRADSLLGCARPAAPTHTGVLAYAPSLIGVVSGDTSAGWTNVRLPGGPNGVVRSCCIRVSARETAMRVQRAWACGSGFEVMLRW